jgi:hypothetical protein
MPFTRIVLPRRLLFAALAPNRPVAVPSPIRCAAHDAKHSKELASAIDPANVAIAAAAAFGDSPHQIAFPHRLQCPALTLHSQ